MPSMKLVAVEVPDKNNPVAIPIAQPVRKPDAAKMSIAERNKHMERVRLEREKVDAKPVTVDAILAETRQDTTLPPPDQDDLADEIAAALDAYLDAHPFDRMSRATFRFVRQCAGILQRYAMKANQKLEGEK